ncbi:MAG TPA: ferredoxin reductase family protein [Actinocrinis sp.]|jgi:predicted ferric reductase
MSATAARRHAAPPAAPDTLPARRAEWTAAALIGAGALPVLALWWQGTTPATLHAPGGVLISAGRAAGLLAAYLLLVLTALMARVPWVENRLGSDAATRVHRALGEYTVALAACHALLIILGYAALDRTGVIAQSIDLELDYPDVLMATAALGLLILIGVLSARAIRARIRYETWYYTHLYVYLAVILAFSHEFADGQDFSTSLRARALWSAAHAAVAAAVLLYRIALPLARSLRHDVRLLRVVPEGPGVISLHLTGRDLDRLRAEPGQFLRWRFLARGHWWQSHPYSLSAAPTADLMRITVKPGADATRLTRLPPGTRVWFEGPYGAFTARRPGARRVLLIAAGVGIAPIRALFETLPGRGRAAILIYRASRPEDLVLYRELEQIARHRGFGLFPLIGPRESRDPLDPAMLRHAAPDLAQREIYLCGPPGFTAAVAAQLRRAGAPAGRIHTEDFGR